MLSRCVASSSDRLLNLQTPLAPGKWVFLSFLAGISISSSTTTPLMSSDKTLQGCKLLFFLVRRNFQLKQNFGQTRQNYIVGHYLKWIFSSVWLSDSHLQEGACYKVMLSSITQDSCKIVNCQWWFENRTWCPTRGKGSCKCLVCSGKDHGKALKAQTHCAAAWAENLKECLGTKKRGGRLS